MAKFRFARSRKLPQRFSVTTQNGQPKPNPNKRRKKAPKPHKINPMTAPLTKVGQKRNEPVPGPTAEAFVSRTRADDPETIAKKYEKLPDPDQQAKTDKKSPSLAAWMTETEFEDLKQEFQRRVKRRTTIQQAAAAGGEDMQKALMNYYADKPIKWVNDWCWTYDPRFAGIEGFNADWPMDLFPRQQELVEWADTLFHRAEDGLIEKSRETGCSYTLLYGCFLHPWLFTDGFLGGLGSRKEVYVDKNGDMKSLFEKLRYALRMLPHWMLPVGWNWRKHSNFQLLVNPNNGSTITGEAGINIGRGGRTTRYLVDEAAYLQQAESADAALSANSRSILWLSTPSPEGMNSLFARKRWSGQTDVFSFKWDDDPRKTQRWYEYQLDKYKYNPQLIAREIDIDYHSASEQQVIPGAWIQAAVGLPLVGGDKVAGYDPGGEGGDERSLITREGPVVRSVRAWNGSNPTQDVMKAAQYAEEMGCITLFYDNIGVGAHVSGTLDALDRRPRFEWYGINGGSSPSEVFYEDDPDQTAKKRFANLRAELWWQLRLKFLRTWERVTEQKYHPDDQCISIPNDPELIQQLGMPTYDFTTTGKVRIESKKNMRKRGLSSPDRADSLTYCFAPDHCCSGILLISRV